MMDPPGHTHVGPESNPPESPQYVTSETGSGDGGVGGGGGDGRCQTEAGPSVPPPSSELRLNFLSNAGDHVNMCLTFVASGVDQPVMSASKTNALWNIAYMEVTLIGFQPLRSWLNLVAPQNIPFMFVTEDTSHDEMSPSNDAAPLKQCAMSVILLVSQVFRSWLKAEAPVNMWFMVVTDDTSHAEMSSLNLVLPLNSPLMSVMPPTFQSGMSACPATPQSAPCLEQHSLPEPSPTDRQLATAAWRSALEANAG